MSTFDRPPEKTATARSQARFAYEGLERVIHEKARLGILASLATHVEGLAFSELKQLCALTDGNLNRHLLVLQEAGLVDVRKDTAGPRPQTICQLTSEGRSRFAEYISVLEQVVQDAMKARPTEPAVAKRMGRGWSPA
jgi:DNA-binding MarR family transcriptional regulator